MAIPAEQKYIVWCEVFDGITSDVGYPLKIDGVVKTYDSEFEAQQTATKRTKAVSIRSRVLQRYTVKPASYTGKR